MNSGTRFDKKSETVSKARGFEVTYNLGEDVLLVDFKTVAGSAFEAEKLEDRMPILMTSQNGQTVQLFLRGGEFNYENEDLTRAVISPIFIVPN